MRLELDLLRFAAPVVMLPALVLRSSEFRVVRRLRSQDARHPDQAVALPEANSLDRWTLRRLIRGRAVRDTAHGRYYLVTEEYNAFRRRRRVRVSVVIAALAGFLVGAWSNGLIG